jgi:hypothetical protein
VGVQAAGNETVGTGLNHRVNHRGAEAQRRFFRALRLPPPKRSSSFAQAGAQPTLLLVFLRASVVKNSW